MNSYVVIEACLQFEESTFDIEKPFDRVKELFFSLLLEE